MALTSLAWLLPVELTPDGLEVVTVALRQGHRAGRQLPVLRDRGRADQPRERSLADDHLLGQPGTAFDHALHLRQRARLDLRRHRARSPEQGHADLRRADRRPEYWAQTRPLGALFFAYPPGSPWHAGPSINHATSPDALHWKPHIEPAIRPHSPAPPRPRGSAAARPPILTEIAGKRGWLTLWHGVEPQADRRHLPHLLVAARSRRAVEGAGDPATRR
jgi:beta-1,2-mannobiose phosphorylase / 1,2-beta-oligomannan phosphorylase